MRAFGYDFGPGHAFVGGFGWIISNDEQFAFIPFPVLEAEAFFVFLFTFKTAMLVFWGVS